MFQKFIEIFNYVDMVKGLVRRDLRGRYKGSILGFFWNFINPLCQVIVFYLVFSNIFRSGIEKFHVYLICGMMTWNFFAESLSQGSGCIVQQAEMTKKIYFPREILPISAVTSRFINLLLTLVVVAGIIAFSGVGFSLKALLFMPLILAIEYCMALGFSLLLSSIDVYFRDFEYMTGVVLMAWMWLTPIMYSLDSVPGYLQKLIAINPMTPIIMGYQSILYYKTVPDLIELGKSAIFAIIILAIGEFVFSKLEGRFAEEL